VIVAALAALAAGGVAYADQPSPATPSPTPAEPATAEPTTPAEPATPAPTTPPATDTADSADAHIARARDLHDKGDFEGARAEILAAYKLDPRPELLFALGQLEFNLHHYREAIDYYERFTATQPNAEQAALAEQAIGAARAELRRPPPGPPAAPPPQVHTRWDGVDSGLAIVGGLAIAAGGGLAFEAVHLSNDSSGTLSDYDHRLDTARHVRIAAAISGGAGIVAIGAALLRWRLHVVADVEVVASPSGAAVSWGGAF
jgi:tetratricopeptide (TPR) repeat protein